MRQAATQTISYAQREQTLYELLSVAPGAGRDQIRAAFRREIRRWHPDLNAHRRDEALEHTRVLIAAYRVLRDAETRKRYNIQIGILPPIASRVGVRGASLDVDRPRPLWSPDISDSAMFVVISLICGAIVGATWLYELNSRTSAESYGAADGGIRHMMSPYDPARGSGELIPDPGFGGGFGL
jgi:hypothetical protein